MKLKDTQEYTNNPFSIPVISVKDYMITYNESEKPMNYVAFSMIAMLDSRAAMNVMIKLGHTRLYGDNEIVLHQELFSEITGIKSRPSYYKIIHELLDKGIIARKKHHKNMFYMNYKYIRTYQPVK